MYGPYAMFVSPAFNAEVESRVVYANKCVRSPCSNVLFAMGDVGEYCGQVSDNLDESHDGQVSDVADRGTCKRSHRIAAPEPYLCFRVEGAKGLDEVGAMEVARGFTGYDVVLHCSCRVLVRRRMAMKDTRVTKSVTIRVLVARRYWRFTRVRSSSMGGMKAAAYHRRCSRG